MEKDKLEIDLEVNDVDIQYRRLSTTGIPIVKTPQDMPWGSRQFTIKDPDGMSIVLSQPIVKK
jgi:uncharacterized glyoxalase superfamily protein PhnB